MITHKQYQDFTNEYFAYNIVQFQRFGQAFMNHFGINEPNPLLFYETRIKKAMKIIEENYVK